MELVQRLLNGDKKALARLLSIVENNEQKAAEAIGHLYPHIGRAQVVGITGAPGAGKSTLVDGLTFRYRELGKRVGVLAVDPTSPFTGGAILGDRIRMQSRWNDDQVFIRSVATRGSLGGLSRATADFVKLLDAFGADVILIETVGTGQSEVDIMSLAHTTVVVLAPGNGDDVQTIKAGIMEIGDVFVVNKADNPEANRAAREVEAMLLLKKKKQEDWHPSVLQAIARDGQGIVEIVDEIQRHFTYLIASGRREQKERERVKKELEQRFTHRLVQDIQFHVRMQEKYEAVLERVVTKRVNPYTAVEELLSFYKHVQ